MLIIITKIDVDWGQAFLGYVPSKTNFKAGGLYTCEYPVSKSEMSDIERSLFSAIGIIGATVMPHSLFLGSALATQDRVSTKTLKGDGLSNSSLESLPEERRPSGILNRIKSSMNKTFRIKALDSHKNRPQRHEDWENNPYLFVKSHVYHGVVDIVLSLLGVAVLINSMWVLMMEFNFRMVSHDHLIRILILASAVFYYGQGRFRTNSQDPASLFDAHDLLVQYIGKRESHILWSDFSKFDVVFPSCWCAIRSRVVVIRSKLNDYRDCRRSNCFRRFPELVDIGPPFITCVR
jgi:metal iron transporter